MKKKKPVIDFKEAIHTARPVSFYIALLLGLFFLVVSFQKLMHPHGFATAVFRGHIMPYPLVNIAALIFMSLEFTAAFAVVFLPRFRRAGLWILVCVVSIYTGCITINLFRDLNTVCGCFGSGARTAAINHWTVVRNLGLILTGLLALR